MISCIVVAWLDAEAVMVKPGKPEFGRPPIWDFRPAPKAVMWLNEGGESDLEKASEYAQTLGGAAYSFPLDTPNPLDLARSSEMDRNAVAFARRMRGGPFMISRGQTPASITILEAGGVSLLRTSFCA